jgi:hypothetical protein
MYAASNFPFFWSYKRARETATATPFANPSYLAKGIGVIFYCVEFGSDYEAGH